VPRRLTPPKLPRRRLREFWLTRAARASVDYCSYKSPRIYDDRNLLMAACTTTRVQLPAQADRACTSKGSDLVAQSGDVRHSCSPRRNR
jgi:hypothetical protein